MHGRSLLPATPQAPFREGIEMPLVKVLAATVADVEIVAAGDANAAGGLRAVAGSIVSPSSKSFGEYYVVEV